MQAKKSSAALKTFGSFAIAALLTFSAKNAWANQIPKSESTLKTPPPIVQSLPKTMDFRKRETPADGYNKQKLQTDNSGPTKVQTETWFLKLLETYLYKGYAIITAGDTIHFTAPPTHLTFHGTDSTQAIDNRNFMRDSIAADIPGSQAEWIKFGMCLSVIPPGNFQPLDSLHFINDSLSAYLGDEFVSQSVTDKFWKDSTSTPQVGFAIYYGAYDSTGRSLIAEIPTHFNIKLNPWGAALLPYPNRYITSNAVLIPYKITHDTTFAIEFGLGDFYVLNGNLEPKVGTYGYGMVFGRKTTDISPISTTVPRTFSLSQNYPNPFNPETTIPFDIRKEGRVTMKVYDSGGRVVKTLVDQDMRSGKYAVSFDASELASGTYYIQMRAGNFSESIKIMLLK